MLQILKKYGIAFVGHCHHNFSLSAQTIQIKCETRTLLALLEVAERSHIGTQPGMQSFNFQLFLYTDKCHVITSGNSEFLYLSGMGHWSDLHARFRRNTRSSTGGRVADLTILFLANFRHLHVFSG